MKLTVKQRENLSPLGKWLMEYAKSHDENLTALARQCGLSSGALRSLVIYPERVPALETCLRLSRVTQVPLPSLLELAGLSAMPEATGIDPDRALLLKVYNGLQSAQLRQVLMSVAEAVRQLDLVGAGR